MRPCVAEPEVECPFEGDDGFADTHCGGFIVEGPDGGGPGNYLVTAVGSDDSGDPVQYTFVAVHQRFGTTLIRGPYNVNWAYLPLAFGEWDVSVTVDDHAQCFDEADDSTCAEVVEVTDPTCVAGELCNVAIRGRASQSSTFFSVAGLAIDGNTDGDYTHDSVTHTNFDDSSPTWEVELDQDYGIESIVLWNRTDCCEERLTNFALTIFTIDDQSNRQEVLSEVFFADGAGFSAPSFEIPIDGEEGRIVQVRLLDTHPGFVAGNFPSSTDEEAKNGWTAETLTAYLAERALAQSKLSLSMFDRKPPRPKRANHRYSPFDWRAGRGRAN